MKLLLVSDLHLTASPEDFYRWEVFNWIKQQKTDGVVILGDLCDFKDRHPAALVNRVCGALRWISEDKQVRILMGNHDYVDPTKPFFEFLNFMPNVRFYSTPVWEWDCAFLPHTRDPKKDWLHTPINPKAVFMHQTVNGSIASNGFTMEGLSGRWLKQKFPSVQIFSGDIHVPQEVGDLFVYVGSPYPVRFGDDFVPRVIRLNTETGKWKSIKRDTIQKLTVTITKLSQLKGLELRDGDLVKVTIKLPRQKLEQYGEMAERVRDKLGHNLAGIDLEVMQRVIVGETFERTITSDDAFDRYVKQLKIKAGLARVGRELIREHN